MCRSLDAFEEALYIPDFADPVTGWRLYANETAFADWFLLEELVKNAKHSYHSAAFMYKVQLTCSLPPAISSSACHHCDVPRSAYD